MNNTSIGFSAFVVALAVVLGFGALNVAMAHSDSVGVQHPNEVNLIGIDEATNGAVDARDRDRAEGFAFNSYGLSGSYVDDAR